MAKEKEYLIKHYGRWRTHNNLYCDTFENVVEFARRQSECSDRGTIIEILDPISYKVLRRFKSK